jgi:hypothetical protein
LLIALIVVPFSGRSFRTPHSLASGNELFADGNIRCSVLDDLDRNSDFLRLVFQHLRGHGWRVGENPAVEG